MPGAWLVEGRDTRPHSISPVAQNLWSIISSSTEGRLITIAQPEESRRQAISRSRGLEPTKSREEELVVKNDSLFLGECVPVRRSRSQEHRTLLARLTSRKTSG